MAASAGLVGGPDLGVGADRADVGMTREPRARHVQERGAEIHQVDAGELRQLRFDEKPVTPRAGAEVDHALARAKIHRLHEIRAAMQQPFAKAVVDVGLRAIKRIKVGAVIGAAAPAVQELKKHAGIVPPGRFSNDRRRAHAPAGISAIQKPA
jgi:hypothetical protein